MQGDCRGIFPHKDNNMNKNKTNRKHEISGEGKEATTAEMTELENDVKELKLESGAPYGDPSDDVSDL